MKDIKDIALLHLFLGIFIFMFVFFGPNIMVKSMLTLARPSCVYVSVSPTVRPGKHFGFMWLWEQ
jgi:hypothetical protein